MGKREESTECRYGGVSFVAPIDKKNSSVRSRSQEAEKKEKKTAVQVGRKLRRKKNPPEKFAYFAKRLVKRHPVHQ